MYYSDRLVDFVFDTYATVQSKVKEGLELVQERVQKKKVRRRRSHIRRIRSKRIRSVRRRRLEGLKEGRRNDRTDASNSRSNKNRSIFDHLTVPEFREDGFDDCVNRKTDLTDLQSNCHGDMDLKQTGEDDSDTVEYHSPGVEHINQYHLYLT